MRKLNGQFVAIINHSGAPRACAARRIPIAKKIWLPIRPRDVGSHVTVRPPARPFAPRGNQCEICKCMADSSHLGRKFFKFTADRF